MNTPIKSTSVKSWSIADFAFVARWFIVLLLTWQFMHGADHFLKLTREELGKYFEIRFFLIAHITAGGGALVLGPFQFWKRLRQANVRIHRIMGLLYLVAILVSSACAVILATTTAYVISWAYAFSLQVWVSVWISSTFIAYRNALKKKFQLHQEWMTRSYIITLAFIISGLAVKSSIVQQLGTFEEISPSLFWAGWSVPIFVYEIVLSLYRKN